MEAAGKPRGDDRRSPVRGSTATDLAGKHRSGEDDQSGVQEVRGCGGEAEDDGFDGDDWEDGEVERGVLHSLAELGHLDMLLHQVPDLLLPLAVPRVTVLGGCAASERRADQADRLLYFACLVLPLLQMMCLCMGSNDNTRYGSRCDGVIRTLGRGHVVH